MRAVVCESFRGADGMRIAHIDEPRPDRDEIVVAVDSASVSFVDCLMSRGGYQVRPPLPYVPGTDAAGVVVACGEDVREFRPGDRVACGNWYGAFAERMVAKATGSAHLPDDVDFETGSAILQTYGTAWYALVERAVLRAGETLLVTGAAGGVGLACVELAKVLGARVIAVVGSPGKSKAVRERGADEVVDLQSEYLRGRVNELTANEGVDVCIDNVGGARLATLATVMRWNGRLLPVGFAGGDIPALDMNVPLMRNYSIVGANTGAWGERFPLERKRAIDRIMTLVADGRLQPRIDRVLPLERYGEAIAAITDRSAQGRMVLRVS